MNTTTALKDEGQAIWWLGAAFLWSLIILLTWPITPAGAAPLPQLSPNEKTIVRKTYLLETIPVALRTVVSDQSGRSETLHYLFTDHLGSVAAVANESGTLIERARFAPFGEPLTPLSAITSRGYTGHRHDSELGLIYMNARWYDPAVGRFLSADTLVPDPLNPQSMNRYAYVLNNPLKWNDPSGHCAQSDADYEECVAEYRWLQDNGAGGAVGTLTHYQRRADFQILRAVFLSYGDYGLTIASMWDYTWGLVRDSGGDVLFYKNHVIKSPGNIMGYRYEVLNLKYKTVKGTHGRAVVTADDYLVYLFTGNVPIRYTDQNNKVVAEMHEKYHLFYQDNGKPGVKEAVSAINNINGTITVSLSDAVSILAPASTKGWEKLVSFYHQFRSGAEYRDEANYYYYELSNNPQAMRQTVDRSYYSVTPGTTKAHQSWRMSP